MLNKIIKKLPFPFHLQGYEVFVSASIGIASGSREYSHPEHILRDADSALNRAKEKGKARYQIFDSTMREKASQFLQLETDLRKAIIKKNFAYTISQLLTLKPEKLRSRSTATLQHPTRV